MLGLNYVPAADALVALTGDGHIYALDRATGAPLLAAPFVLPGSPTPTAPSSLPPAIVAAADTEFRTLVNVPPGSLPIFTAALLGNGVRVANMFSVDPATSQLWVAATAPDGEDGTVDGVSQLGALFRLGLVAGTAGYQIQEVCHRSFSGGSASTPTVSADGSRIYLGDNTSLLLAIDTTAATRGRSTSARRSSARSPPRRTSTRSTPRAASASPRSSTTAPAPASPGPPTSTSSTSPWVSRTST